MERLPGNWQAVQGVNAVKYFCGFCGLTVSSERGWQVNADPHINKIRVCPYCNRPTFFERKGVQIPGVPYGRPVPNVPAEIDKLYDEARRSTAASAHTAAVLACRKAAPMRCTVCGAELKPTRTDLPLKVGDTRIVIVKSLPVVRYAA